MKEGQMKSDQNSTTNLVDIGKKCNDVFLPVPSVPNCLNCFRNRYCVLLEEEITLTLLSQKERIAHLAKAQQEDDLVLSLMNMNLGDFYEKKLKFEKENLDLMSSDEKNTPTTPLGDAILPQIGQKKTPINGTMIEIGKLLGNFFNNTRNLKGDHVFDIDDITIARWLCASFILVDGREFNLRTMSEYISLGRKTGPKHDN